jgi:hypothetical protein
MCIEDKRLGRELAPGVTSFTLSAAAVTQVLPADPNRVAIVFSTNSANAAFVGPEGITLSTLRGFLLSTATPQMLVRVEEWGRLVTGPWFAFAQGGTPILSIMSCSLEKQ